MQSGTTTSCPPTNVTSTIYLCEFTGEKLTAPYSKAEYESRRARFQAWKQAQPKPKLPSPVVLTAGTMDLKLFDRINWLVGEDHPQLPNKDQVTALGAIKILLPLGRYSSYTVALRLAQKEYTVAQILDAINGFYSAPLSKRLAFALDAENNFGYVKEARSKIDAGETVSRLEVNGDTRFFEGFQSTGVTGVYRLCLGS